MLASYTRTASFSSSTLTLAFLGSRGKNLTGLELPLDGLAVRVGANGFAALDDARDAVRPLDARADFAWLERRVGHAHLVVVDEHLLCALRRLFFLRHRGNRDGPCHKDCRDKQPCQGAG